MNNTVYQQILDIANDYFKSSDNPQTIREFLDNTISLAKKNIISDTFYILSEDKSNTENYDIDIKLICSLIETTKSNTIQVLSRSLPQFNNSGGKFYGDDNLIQSYKTFLQKEGNRVEIIIQNGKIDEGIKNKFITDICNQYTKQVKLYTMSSTKEFPKDERFMIIGEAFKYVKTAGKTIISYKAKDIADVLVEIFNGLKGSETTVEKLL